MNDQVNEQFDIAIIGSGPAGSTAALRAIELGLRPVIIEKDSHPRFHVGESFLPQTLELLRTMGLEDRLRDLPHTVKPGVSLMFADDESPVDLSFSTGLGRDTCKEAFNIARAPFDTMLLDAAREAGAQVLEQTTVTQLARLEDGKCELETTNGTVYSKYVIDASGQSTFIARKTGQRKPIAGLSKVSHYGHFENVQRRPGDKDGSPIFVIFNEGWFWTIPLDEKTTSVGVVLEADSSRKIDVPADSKLRWAIERCPAMSRIMEHADLSTPTHTCADYSYHCNPMAGPGYFMIGDAAVFIDPVFSSGVCVAMMSARQAVESIIDLQAGKPASRVQKTYCKDMKRTSDTFLRLVKNFYTDEFREVFLQPDDAPLNVRGAVMHVLSGYIFPKILFRAKWRMEIFHLFVRMQKFGFIAPRRTPHSIFNTTFISKNQEPSEPLVMQEAGTA